MTRIPFSSSAFAIIGFLVLAAPPASLAGQGVRQRGTASAEGQAVPRSEVRRGGEGQAPPAAQAVPRAVPRAAMPQVRVPQVVQPQVNTLRPNDRPDNRPNYRPDNRPNYRPDNRPNYRPGNQPNYRPDNQPNYRPNNQPNYRPNYQPNYRADNRSQYRPNYRPLYRPSYRPYYRPYYTFLPRVRLGFGLWIGYPVRYPTYFYPYPSYPYAYTPPYPTATYPVPATPSVGAAGGLSFEITPPEAGVYVDGLYIGTVEQFTPNQPPLSLAPGRHHVEIREPGFEIIAFDVDILPGQVIPYRGELRPF